ncbi:ThuA domain-containing protein [Lentisphaera marina]|uniref:DUF7133 domain-containing protein n=1 Tax=Lentisphaera marina TaxID=1111041 RepID=UPI0023653215|nr:ThuA domain-containing protein [Lentisphaera marina]MDD7986569.1 ThuA domain-containing protein [Lentisphaera marina]
MQDKRKYLQRNFRSLLLFTGLSLSLSSLALDQETKDKVIAASQSSEAVKVKSARKLLALSSGKNTPLSHYALQQLGEQKSAFTVDFSSDLSNLDLNTLKKYDGVFLSQKIADDIFKSKKSKSAVLQYINEGGKLIATDEAIESKSSEFHSFIGAASKNYPWDESGTWSIVNEAPSSVSTKHFDQLFKIKDRIYALNDFDRSKMRILLALDFGDRLTTGTHSKLADVPVSWVKEVGKGHIFYTSLGFNDETWYNKDFLQHLLSGIQMTLGDLQGDFSPITKKPRSPHIAKALPLTEEESMKTFEIQDGYNIQLSAGDKFLNEPVHIAWDGNGNLYVAQMQTYMQDAAASREKDPVCTVLKLVDSDWDGVYDKKTVFAKDLILPRKLLCLDGKIIIGETDTTTLYAYEDTNGDGVADKKELFYKGGPQGGNMEHQPQGFMWNLDNTINATYGLSYRYKDGTFTELEYKAAFGSQFGLSQTESGQIVSAIAGNEKATMHFQQPHLYGGMELEGEKSKEFYELWPIDSMPDSQGGLKRMREDNTLNHFTATSGAEYYRGGVHSDLKHDFFLAEPVGRLIRRAKIENKGGMRILHNAYPKKEFIRSTDPNFRPVNLATGPDGNLYIVDMYRGIIQQAAYARPGMYIYRINDVYELDKNIGRGRLYRVTKEGQKSFSKPNMLNESSQQLLAHLSHKNAWWRLKAQKLIIVRKDLSVLTKLQNMAINSKSELARLHALWTIDGLGKTNFDILKKAVKDSSPLVREAAIRLSEPYLKKDKSAIAGFIPIKSETNSQVLVQIKNSLRTLGQSDLLKTLYDTHRDKHYGLGRMEQYHAQQAKEEAEKKLARKALSAANAETIEKGAAHYKALCQNCHGKDGMGMKAGEILLGAPLVGSPRVLGDIQRLTAITLNGLKGPIDGKDYGVMMPLNNNSDEYIAEVLSFIRHSWNNKASIVTTKEVQTTRKDLKKHKEMFTLDTLYDRYPSLLNNHKKWKLSANVNNDKNSLDKLKKANKRWTSMKPMVKGHYVQIQLPGEAEIKGLQMMTNESAEYEVQLSLNGKNWTKAGILKSKKGISSLSFKTSKAKYLKVMTLTKAADSWFIRGINLMTTNQ